MTLDSIEEYARETYKNSARPSDWEGPQVLTDSERIDNLCSLILELVNYSMLS